MDAPVSLAELARELLLFASQVAEGQSELPEGPGVGLKVKAALEHFQTEARQAGHKPGDIDDARYALAALIDEVIQFSQWSGKLEWAARPLQAELYGERMAGVRFFERMETVKSRSASVLEVYHLCLGLGFQGRYRMGKPEELTRLLQGSLAQLNQEVAPALAPDGLRDGVGTPAARPFPGLLVGLGTLALAVVVGLGLLAYTRQSASNAAEQIATSRS